MLWAAQSEADKAEVGRQYEDLVQRRDAHEASVCD